MSNARAQENFSSSERKTSISTRVENTRCCGKNFKAAVVLKNKTKNLQ